MGSVHRCYDHLAQRYVAYKRLRTSEAAALPLRTALFQREYDTLAKLAHPNVVEVFDYGFDANGPYYTMELLTGADLAAKAPLSFREGSRLLRDVASALALLHARRLVHRDVTPSNVRLTSDGRAKLIDFGALATFGKPNEVVGTPVFVAPEALHGEPLDQRADLYALGALAYWTFTGRTHLRARSLEDLPAAWSAPVAPLSAHVTELPSELNELVLSLLQVDRNARLTTAADVIARLTSIAALDPEADEQRVAHAYLTHPPLVGRTAETAHIRDGLRATFVGGGRTVWIEGERGLGRSALLNDVSVEAQLLGATVLRSDAARQREAFATARALVNAGLLALPAAASLLSEATLRIVRQSGVDEGAPAVRSAVDAADRHVATSTALGDALLALAAQGPLLLLVDDVHLADEDSLALFAANLDALHARPIMLMLSSPPAVRERDTLTATLKTKASVLRLAALAEAELLSAIQIMFGNVPNTQRLAAWLHGRTRGNPGQALDLARLLLANGAIRYVVGTFVIAHAFGEYVPSATATATQLARLTGLSATARRVAELLAVHDAPLAPELLARALSLATPIVLDGLAELSARGAVRAEGGDYSCESEGLGEALRAALEPALTRELHRALATALRGRILDSLEKRLALARHLMLAGGAEQTEGARLVAQAGDAHRYESARMARQLPLFERALGILTEEGLDDYECIGVLLPLSLAGFYGDLALQRAYLDRTLRALSRACGLDTVTRLSRWLGPKLGLIAGLAWGYAGHRFRKRELNTRSFAQNLAAYAGTVVVTTGVIACTYDSAETFRVARYCEPFRGASRRSGLYCMREFCLATAELMAGRVQSAQRRYAYVAEVFSKPVPGLDEIFRDQANLGCLNGRAYALSIDERAESLTCAEELARRAVFYRPHAECVRMSHYANRGEVAQANEHLRHAEEAALRGGAAWSALCSLNARYVQACTLYGDVVALVRAVAELERLAHVSTSMSAIAALGRAHLEQLRGNVESALTIYEEVTATEVACRLPTAPFDASMFARALLTIGRFERAKEICESALLTQHEAPWAYLLPRQVLALAHAHLGAHDRALELLRDALVRAETRDNPLTLGSVQRDFAYAAALRGDLEGYTQHFELMRNYYESTRNPMLLQQCEALRTYACGLGIVPQVQLRSSFPANDAYDVGTTALPDTSDAENPLRRIPSSLS